MTLLGLFLGALAGSGLGLFFYVGLLFTLQFALPSVYAAAWIGASFLLRMIMTMAGFYWLADHHWQSFIAALIGFSLVGIAMRMRMQKPAKQTDHSHKPQQSRYGS